ncbi:OLC1v1032887C1 [Oldenlandia corymbosa var. corymbosa]|uniref:OLC1v1032887C1 n=1 Tax=Oldenlandia corymbosa var. corymbosa TaxID=529605 RepID=A0AAV1CM63_OLDCO|nr:OLC1v1032887C1 [Oldenlandia corymbosa var. corymbosa]
MAFRRVCATWRSAAAQVKFIPSCPTPPLLMLPEEEEKEEEEKKESDEREFYSVSKGKVSMRLSLPELKGKFCIEARFGWLLAITDEGDDVILLNPFSRSQIKLPNFQTFLEPERKQYCHKIHPKTLNDFILMAMHCCDVGLLCFWRPGDTTSWTKLESRKGTPHDVSYYQGTLVDVNYCNGKFYAINVFGHIWGWDDDDGRHARIHGKLFLVESEGGGGHLLMITRDLDCDNEGSGEICFCNEHRRGTKNFNVYRLDTVKGGSWEEITNLGGNAIFVGDNATSLIPCMEGHRCGIKADCIYFTDDSWDVLAEDDFISMGVYNVQDGSMERFHGVNKDTENFIIISREVS